MGRHTHNALTERGFLHSSAAVRYTDHLGPQRGQARAGAIRAHGEPVEPDLDRTFLVASTSFVRGLSAAWEACAPAAFSSALFDLRGLPREYAPWRVRDLLVDHIVAHGGVLPAGGAKRDGRQRVLAPGREGRG